MRKRLRIFSPPASRGYVVLRRAHALQDKTAFEVPILQWYTPGGLIVGEGAAMSPELKRCKAQALKLPPKDRALLAEQLLASLDALDAAENEHLWIEEAARRYQGYKKGRVRSRPARDAIRDARSRIGASIK